ncbi:MAG: VIT1/CCC1 transporter family protein [Candidatus Brockarchaeota archaeon]|nr:VIT1/CCC1 transporter family protein [Candidatus Brockarchaeota archaeon]
MNKMLDEGTRKSILAAQRNEITEHHVYEKLSKASKDPNNAEVLKRISEDERKHYDFWKSYTGEEARPDGKKIWWYSLLSRLFGITFGLKLMEKGEEKAQATYDKISGVLPEAKRIVKDEDVHEAQLLQLIDEERLRYVGSVVLGLSDALVELTGTLAGLTLALQSARLIAMVGLITGVAASLSMATSEYLSTKSEGGTKNPLKASTYTGFAYVLTVFLLILPYLVFENFYLCLASAILNAIAIILVFTFYISVAKDLPFRNRFLEMATVSLGIAALSFGIGFVVRLFLDVEV